MLLQRIRKYTDEQSYNEYYKVIVCEEKNHSKIYASEFISKEMYNSLKDRGVRELDVHTCERKATRKN